MKKINLTIYLGLFTLFLNFGQAQNTNSQGQGNQQWKINGNIADENYYFGTKNQFPIKFRTNDIERFRITPSGEFGIGTSNPESILDVNGNVILREGFKLLNIENIESGDDKLLFIKNNGTVAKGGLEHLKSIMYSSAGASDGSCGDGGVYNDNNPTWRNGLNKIYYKCPQIKVGIGIETPNFTLHVKGNTFITSYIGNSALINQRMTVGPTNALDLNYNLKVVGNSFLDGNIRTEGVTINSSTNANQKAIEINYTTNADFSHATLFSVNRDLTKALVVRNSVTNKENFIVYGDGNISTKRINISTDIPIDHVSSLFLIENAERKVFQVDNNGLVHARKMVLDVYDNWPDYVFEKEYQLMPSTTL